MRNFVLRSMLPWLVIAAAIFAYSPADLVAAEPHGEAAAAGDDHHEEGVPLSWKADLAIWSVVTFLVFVVVLRKFAWGPLSSGLDNREARFRQSLADAEAARVRAEKMLAEHAAKLEQVQDEVKEILAEARRDADHTKNEIIGEAQREAEASKRRAIQEIERSRDQALAELFDHMAKNIADATEHVLGRALNDEDQGRLIEDALSQVGASQSR